MKKIFIINFVCLSFFVKSQTYYSNTLKINEKTKKLENIFVFYSDSMMQVIGNDVCYFKVLSKIKNEDINCLLLDRRDNVMEIVIKDVKGKIGKIKYINTIDFHYKSGNVITYFITQKTKQ